MFGTELDLLDLDDLLLFARLVLLFLGFVLVLSEIQNLADRRLGIGRDLDQVECRLGGHIKSFAEVTTPDHLPVGVDQSDGADIDFAVDARTVPGLGRGSGRLDYVNFSLSCV